MYIARRDGICDAKLSATDVTAMDVAGINPTLHE